jgi:hypothetical protein
MQTSYCGIRALKRNIYFKYYALVVSRVYNEAGGEYARFLRNGCTLK